MLSQKALNVITKSSKCYHKKLLMLSQKALNVITKSSKCYHKKL